MAENRQVLMAAGLTRPMPSKTYENAYRPENPCKIIALHMQRGRSCTATKFVLRRTIGAYIGSVDSGLAGEGTEQCC
jgi:hypothetical protein